LKRVRPSLDWVRRPQGRRRPGRAAFGASGGRLGLVGRHPRHRRPHPPEASGVPRPERVGVGVGAGV